MKSIKDIENISLEQLEAVSMDESITVPDGFAARMKENADAAVTAGLLTGNESEGQGRRKAVMLLPQLLLPSWQESVTGLHNGRTSRRILLMTRILRMRRLKRHLQRYLQV